MVVYSYHGSVFISWWCTQKRWTHIMVVFMVSWWCIKTGELTWSALKTGELTWWCTRNRWNHIMECTQNRWWTRIRSYQLSTGMRLLQSFPFHVTPVLLFWWLVKFSSGAVSILGLSCFCFLGVSCTGEGISQMETRREKSQSAAAGQVLKHGMNLNFRKKSSLGKRNKKKEMPSYNNDWRTMESAHACYSNHLHCAMCAPSSLKIVFAVCPPSHPKPFDNHIISNHDDETLIRTFIPSVQCNTLWAQQVKHLDLEVEIVFVPKLYFYHH